MPDTNDGKNKYGHAETTVICDGLHQIVRKVNKYGGGAIPTIMSPPPVGDVAYGELAGTQQRLTRV